MKKLLPVTPLIKRTALLFMFLTTLHFVSLAQDCGCDFVINPPASPTTSLFIDGDVLGVKPGQTICLTAGLYKQIRFIRIAGEPGNPVTIKNCGGLAQLGDEINYGRWYATDIVSCKYVRYTGTGDPAYRYGIKLGKSGDSALKIGLSTDIEIDHLEIGHANFAGILAKTDYGGNPPPGAPEMNNLHIHDNYIHDTRGEGMYLGETKSPGENMRHLEVWNNIVTRTGLELIQVANAVEDIQIHHNVLYKGGLRNVLYQNKGFQIGDNSVGRYYNNFLIGSPSNAMIIMGSGNIEITNNYIADVGGPGFFIDNRLFTVPGTPIDIHKNFIMDVNESYPFFNIFNEINPIAISGNALEGNNVLTVFGSEAGANVTTTGNTLQVIERVQFTNDSIDDFTLASASAYQDLGLIGDVSSRNQRPYIALIPSHTLDFETTLEVPVSATDPDGDVVSLEAFNLPSFVSFTDNGGGKGVFSLAPLAGDVGVYYKVRVRVTDSKGAMNTQNFNITVLDPYAFLATASSSLLNTFPENTLDSNMATRWAAGSGTGNWIKYNLREDKIVTSVGIAFYNGATTVYPFNIEVSEDENTWVQVFSGANSGTTANFETFTFDSVRARFLRIVDNGTGLNSYNEVQINCTTAPQTHLSSASDDVYLDGSRIFDRESLKLKEGKVTSYLRFEVSGLNVVKAPVISATLKLTALANGNGNVKIYLGDNRHWSESDSKASGLPQPVRVLDTLISGLFSGQQYELNVSSAIADNGVYNFILMAEGAKGNLTFSSAEGQFQPELSVVTLRGAVVGSTGETGFTVTSDGSDLSNVEESQEEVLDVFPNPVQDKITLDLGPGQSSAHISVEISDKAGKPFFQQHWVNAGQLIEIDLNAFDMEPGVYYLKVKQDEHPLRIIRMFKL